MKNQNQTISVTPAETLWVEKYRPRKISECILPKRIKSQFEAMVNTGVIPNMILSGSAGVGKTTIAKAIADELGSDVLFINASKDGNIDTLRTVISDFATTVSLSGKGKVVILDEADYLNPVSTQPSLRSFIEQNSKNCRFIMTCNYPMKIIEPLRSRCMVINFDLSKNDLPELGPLAVDRLQEILALEGKSVKQTQILAKYFVENFPDFRKSLNNLQILTQGISEVDVGILGRQRDISIEKLCTAMKKKNFKEVREWVAENSHIDTPEIFNKLYHSLYEYLVPSSIPTAILTIAEYSYRSAFVVDQEINTMAAMIEFMSNCEFKT